MHSPTTNELRSIDANIAIIVSSFYTIRSTENYELELVKNAINFLGRSHGNHDDIHIDFDVQYKCFKSFVGVGSGVVDCAIEIEKLHLVIVPGAMEIPQGVQWAIEKHNIDGVLALGCVIRGETTHYDHVCHTAISGISQIALQTKVPIINAIVTAENDKTAKERCFAEIDGKQVKNLGFHGMNALIDMIKLKNSL